MAAIRYTRVLSCSSCALNFCRKTIPHTFLPSLAERGIFTSKIGTVFIRSLSSKTLSRHQRENFTFASVQPTSFPSKGRRDKSTQCGSHSFFSEVSENIHRGQCRYFSEKVAVPEEDFSGTDNNVEKLIQSHLTDLCDNIKKELRTSSKHLQKVSQYYFDGQGKYFRPIVVLLMARACNKHANSTHSVITSKQETVAMIAEMIHTASLLHDDVIDCASTRRSKPSINGLFGDQNSIIAGDFVMSRASMALARTGNEIVVELIATVIRDLVRGELLQLIPGPDSNLEERFDLYLRKTYQKTASLIAFTCKSVAVLSGASSDVQEIAYEYGRHLGLAFQLIDDVLDFVSSEEMMGKPAAADLKLGLATAPVLYAAQKFPELDKMISRKFSHPGDVEKARYAVENSDGISKTYEMASQHCHDAVHQISQLCPSPERDALVKLTEIVLSRKNKSCNVCTKY